MINLYSRLKFIDLHGESASYSRVAINDFIKEAYLYNYKKVIIIHGIGQGVIRGVCKEVLSNNKYVEEFKLDNFNEGQTIVTIKSKN